MSRIFALLAALAVVGFFATGTPVAPINPLAVTQAIAQKAPAKQGFWARQKVKWAKQKEKYAACRKEAKDQNLRGTKRWSFVSRCMRRRG